VTWCQIWELLRTKTDLEARNLLHHVWFLDECHKNVVGFIFVIKQSLEGLQFNLQNLWTKLTKIMQPYLYRLISSVQKVRTILVYINNISETFGTNRIYFLLHIFLSEERKSKRLKLRCRIFLTSVSVWEETEIPIEIEHVHQRYNFTLYLIHFYAKRKITSQSHRNMYSL